MNFLFGGLAVLFLMMTLSAWFHSRWARRLPALPDSHTTPAQRPVRCSVVLAARNEEARIENTIRHLLRQSGVEIEVIAVDDRSTDRTSEILRCLAAEDARVRVQRVDALLEGWLGKSHVC